MRGGRPLDLQPHGALPRGAGRRGARQPGRRARCSRSRGTTPRRSRPSRTDSPTSRPRSISSASPPGSTRWFPGRARSSGRCATRSRPARPARCSTGRSGWRSTPGGGRGSRRRSVRARRRSRPPRPRWREQVFDGLAGRRVVLVGAGQDERADCAQPPLARRGRRVRREPVGRARRSGSRASLGADGARRSTSSPPRSPTRTSSSRRRARQGSSSAATSSLRRSRRAAAGRCSSSTSPSRATSIRRCRRSTAASSTTSTTSRRSSQRRSQGAAPRRCRPSGSSPPRPSGSRAWQASLAVVPAIASLRAQRRGDPGRRARAARVAPRAALRRASAPLVETVTAADRQQAAPPADRAA